MSKKVVLITGASSGLGKQISKFLLKNGYVVYAGYRSNKISKAGVPIKLDITSNSDCEDTVTKIIKEKGRIDVLINNAGYTLVGPIEKNSPQDYLDILNTNTVGALRLIKMVLPYMKKQKNGKIINITSLNGLVSMPRFGMYSASKHSLQALGEALRYEVAKDGVWVTNIAPGAIASEDKKKEMSHKTAREKLLLLKFLFPMVKGTQIAKTIEDIIGSSRPPATVLMGRDAKIVVFLKRILPSFLWDRLMFYIFK